MRTTYMGNDGPVDGISREAVGRWRYFVVSTKFHGGGILSRHHSEGAADRACKRARVGDCVCGCACVVPADGLHGLRGATDSMGSSPYAPAL
jgi:hypothetical protein